MAARDHRLFRHRSITPVAGAGPAVGQTRSAVRRAGHQPDVAWPLPVSPRRVLEELPAGVIVTDPVGSILFSNTAAQALFGWSATDVLGRNVAETLAAPEDADEVALAFRAGATGESWEGEVRAIRQDGTHFVARVTVRPVVADDGRVAVLVGLWRVGGPVGNADPPQPAVDDRFALLIKSSGDLFALADASGVILHIDGPTQESYGLVADELVGSSAWTLVHPADRERAQEVWARRLATTRPMPAEDFWIQRPNGSWLCFSTVFTNCFANSAMGAVAITARDVTERRHLEQARIAISGANSALIQAGSESELFDAICQVVVDDITYHSAWIGVTDATQPLGVRIVAFANHSPAYFEAFEHLTGSERSQGPLSQTFATRELHVVQDVEAVPGDPPWRRLALDHGYRSIITLPLFLDKTDYGVLAIYSEQANVFTEDAVAVLAEFAKDLSFGVEALRNRAERNEYRAKFEGSLEATVQAIATASELRDLYTAGHQHRVAELAAAIAKELGFADDVVLGIEVAATIHDIGKLAIPSEILSRPARLNEHEFALIKQHARAGYDIISGIAFPWPVADIVLQHHERLDGSGYPNGLHGEEVSIGARILAVADTVEAMHSHRPYRPGLGIDLALRTVQEGSGTLFDPDVVDACTRLFTKQAFAFTL